MTTKVPADQFPFPADGTEEMLTAIDNMQTLDIRSTSPSIARMRKYRRSWDCFRPLRPEVSKPKPYDLLDRSVVELRSTIDNFYERTELYLAHAALDQRHRAVHQFRAAADTSRNHGGVRLCRANDLGPDQDDEPSARTSSIQHARARRAWRPHRRGAGLRRLFRAGFGWRHGAVDGQRCRSSPAMR